MHPKLWNLKLSNTLDKRALRIDLELFKKLFFKTVRGLTMDMKNDPPRDRRRNAIAGDTEIGPTVHPGHSGYHQTLAGFVVSWPRAIFHFAIFRKVEFPNSAGSIAGQLN